MSDILTLEQLDEILAMCNRMKVVGEKPNTIIMPASVARVATVQGTNKQRKRARFWNRKRVEHFRKQGLDIRIINVAEFP